jgi:histidine triad (HIT) family protein
MNDSQLLEFLQKNGMIKDADSRDNKTEPESGQQCIFCSIISGQIPSTKISEDENSIAILELNPLSEGHTLIIPKQHENPLDEKTIIFAEEVKKILNESLNPKQILAENSNLFGHNIINLVPVYGNEIPNQRKQSNPEDLKSIQNKMLSNKKEESKNETPKEEKEILDGDNTIIPKRIP